MIAQAEKQGSHRTPLSALERLSQPPLHAGHSEDRGVGAARQPRSLT
jgi:hypothetical protein